MTKDLWYQTFPLSILATSILSIKPFVWHFTSYGSCGANKSVAVHWTDLFRRNKRILPMCSTPRLKKGCYWNLHIKRFVSKIKFLIMVIRLIFLYNLNFIWMLWRMLFRNVLNTSKTLIQFPVEKLECSANRHSYVLYVYEWTWCPRSTRSRLILKCLEFLWQFFNHFSCQIVMNTKVPFSLACAYFDRSHIQTLWFAEWRSRIPSMFHGEHLGEFRNIAKF